MEVIRKTAVISGGSGAVGRAVGQQLSREGYDVVVLYRTAAPEELRSVLGGFAPGKHKMIRCDIRDEAAVAASIAEVASLYEHIDVCVHAALGAITRKHVLEMDNASFKEQFETGLFGGFNFLKATALVMKKQKSGVLIGVLSRALEDDAPATRMAGYVVAKYALRGLLRELAQEFVNTDVRVNAIAPDFMDTPLHSDLPREVVSFIKERAPSGSMRTPEDVGRAAAFLASGKGKWMRSTIYSFDEREIKKL
jgi:NAD(P)-dependent dehydrogenase (short-subunit alcohol dehydrogenase family)